MPTTDRIGARVTITGSDTAFDGITGTVVSLWAPDIWLVELDRWPEWRVRLNGGRVEVRAEYLAFEESEGQA